MKKPLIALFLSLLVLIAAVSVSSAEYLLAHHHINNRGDVVWQGESGGKEGFFLYDGATVRLLDERSVNNSAETPQINDNGQVVWVEGPSDTKVLLYANSTITRINDEFTVGYWPQINDNGQVAWWGAKMSVPDPLRSDPEFQTCIFLYDGAGVRKIEVNDIDDDDCFNPLPQISNNGHVVWWGGFKSADSEIYLYNGTSVTQLTDNEYRDAWPHINDSGQVVWTGDVDGENDEIFLYDGSTIHRLSDNDENDGLPQINAAGHVVWQRSSEIFLYDGATVTQIGSGVFPQINDSGHVVWSSEGELISGNLVYKVLMYDGATTTEIANNGELSLFPQINNDDHITWMSDGVVYYRNGTETFPLVYDPDADPGIDRGGDNNDDDDVDLDDVVDDVVGAGGGGSSGGCFIRQLF